MHSVMTFQQHALTHSLEINTAQISTLILSVFINVLFHKELDCCFFIKRCFKVKELKFYRSSLIQRDYSSGIFKHIDDFFCVFHSVFNHFNIYTTTVIAKEMQVLIDGSKFISKLCIVRNFRNDIPVMLG